MSLHFTTCTQLNIFSPSSTIWHTLNPFKSLSELFNLEQIYFKWVLMVLDWWKLKFCFQQSLQPNVNNNPPAVEKSSPVDKKPTTPVTPVEQLRQWIDSYEEAVTNHYSPELRARIASIKVNGIHSDLKLPTNLLTTPKCRVSLLPSGIKVKYKQFWLLSLNSSF